MPDDADHPTAGHQAVAEFLVGCRDAMLTATAGLPSHAPEHAGVSALTTAIDGASVIGYEPSWLPALDTIDEIRSERADDLVDRFVALAPLLPWTPTFRSDDGGRELALALLNEAFDYGDTTVGLMYVSPGATYPLHHHPSHELYLTVGGSGNWRYGGHTDAETVGPRRLLYNHPDDLHSATAGHTPLLALFVLW